MAEAALGLGSNLGDKAGAIRAALRLLEESPEIKLTRTSRFYRTPPWGDTDQDWFLNACAIVRTALPPTDLLERCLQIEAELGRDRAHARRWGPRAIDIDLLFYDNAKISQPGLILPHPHLLERAFVLVPLSEIAAEKLIAGTRIADAAAALDCAGIEAWTPT